KIRTHIFEKGVLVNANDLLIDLFNNLLNNSIKYNESHVVEIDVKMSKEKKNNTNYIKLEFLDNGIGIPDKRKETLFEKEYSKDIASKGLGIGLTLVKKIVDSYRGEIWVEDRIKGDYSQGSNFIVLIPEA
ncbi:MAG: Signal transduction histidine kinase, partial [Candidatus Lokiarchaeum sp. GC14_75]